MGTYRSFFWDFYFERIFNEKKFEDSVACCKNMEWLKITNDCLRFVALFIASPYLENKYL